MFKKTIIICSLLCSISTFAAGGYPEITETFLKTIEGIEKLPITIKQIALLKESGEKFNKTYTIDAKKLTIYTSKSKKKKMFKDHAKKRTNHIRICSNITEFNKKNNKEKPFLRGMGYVVVIDLKANKVVINTSKSMSKLDPNDGKGGCIVELESYAKNLVFVFYKLDKKTVIGARFFSLSGSPVEVR